MSSELLHADHGLRKRDLQVMHGAGRQCLTSCTLAEADHTLCAAVMQLMLTPMQGW